jgi:carbon-monoxide dehydrogenase medium subunit
MADVHVATDVDDAVRMLATRPGRAMAVAGGTDLVLDQRLGRIDPELLVDLSRLDTLRGIVWDGDQVAIGALTTIRAVELDAGLLRRASALVDAARVLGSVQIRTMATVGGNLCHATPSAELPPALLVHDATVVILGPSGARVLAALARAPGVTALADGELVTAVRASAAAGSGSCYLRQTVRWAMDLAGVGVAAWVQADSETILAARVALGAVAPVPLLVDDAAAAIVGRPFDTTAAARAGAIAASAAAPITDARGTAEYRRAVVAALVPRALRIAWLRATGAWHGTVPTHGRLDEDAA